MIFREEEKWIEHAEEIGGEPEWKRMKTRKTLIKISGILSTILLALLLLGTIVWLFVGGPFPLHPPAAVLLFFVGVIVLMVFFGLSVEDMR